MNAFNYDQFIQRNFAALNERLRPAETDTMGESERHLRRRFLVWSVRRCIRMPKLNEA